MITLPPTDQFEYLVSLISTIGFAIGITLLITIALTFYRLVMLANDDLTPQEVFEIQSTVPYTTPQPQPTQPTPDCPKCGAPRQSSHCEYCDQTIL